MKMDGIIILIAEIFQPSPRPRSRLSICNKEDCFILHVQFSIDAIALFVELVVKNQIVYDIYSPIVHIELPYLVLQAVFWFKKSKHRG